MFEDLPELAGDAAAAARRNPAIAAVAICLFLLVVLRRPSSSASASPASGLGSDPEYRRDWLEYQGLVSRYGVELARLSGDQSAVQQRLALEREQQRLTSPLASEQCVPWSQWYVLPARDRQSISQQVRNGKLVLRPSASGMCLIVSGAGASGHQPLVTVDQSAGIFGSSSSVTAPAGQVPGIGSPTPPVIGQVIDSLGRIIR